MIKTPLSIAIGGVGFYTKNTMVIGGHKSEPEPPFNIASVFSNGEQGLWLDPNDLSTMFQDAAGINSISAGQTAGLILHSSKNTQKRRNMLADSSLSLGISSITTRGGKLTIIDDKYIKLDTVNKTVDSYAYMRPVLPLGTRVTFSVSLKREDGKPINPAESYGSDCRIVADGNALTGSALSIVDIGSGGVRISTSYEITKSSSSCGIVKYKFSSDVPVIAWDYQIDVGDEATAYQDTFGQLDWDGKFGAYQVDSAKQMLLKIDDFTGFKYLEADGVDDCYITQAIDFTHTDKITIVAAVRKLSDVNAGIVLEHGNAANDSKAFTLDAPPSAGSSRYGLNLRNTSRASIFADARPAPRASVLTGLLDYTGTSISTQVKLSENGGTDNLIENGAVLSVTKFGNYPIYVGRRGGVSLAFKGHIYGLLIIDRILTDVEIQKVEAEFAKRMGITL